MPKSKRARVIHTSNVQKKPSREKAATLYAAVQTAATTYTGAFAFRVDNMRNTYLKNVRAEFAEDGRLFFGKTKVMAKALGSGTEDEVVPGIAALSGVMGGAMGLLFTDRAVADVRAFFDGLAEVDFARAGLRAPRGMVVPAGVVYSTGGEQAAEDDVPLPHSLEATVRKWGMPTKLEKGRVMLGEEYAVCEKGRVLDSNQTALLKLFGVAMAEFRVHVVAYWTAAAGEVTVLDAEAAKKASGDVEAGASDEADEVTMEDG